MSFHESLGLLRKAARRDQMQHVVAPAEHIRLVGAAQARRGFNQRIKNRLEFDGRAAYDLKYVRGGGLLLQRLLEIVRLGLYLVEQADVADRDHGLVGEGLQQPNLFLAEWT